MNKLSFLAIFVLLFGCLSNSEAAMILFDDGHVEQMETDLAEAIPEIEYVAGAAHEKSEYRQVSDVAQYKQADWNNVVGIQRGISVRKAKKIANQHPEVTYFFRVKGLQMVLETNDGQYRLFHHGDTVFFSGTPWWGSAPDLADGFIKIEKQG